MDTDYQRIAILSPTGRSGTRQHGGITPVVVTLANELLAQGHEVDLLVFQPRHRVTEIPGLATGVATAQLGQHAKLRTAFEVWRYLRRRKPAAMLAAGQRANLIAAWVKRVARPHARMVGSIHNTLSQGLGGRAAWQRRRRIRQWRRMIESLDAVVTVSHGVAADVAALTDLPQERFRVIHNPVVTPELHARAAQPAPHPWLEGSTPVVVAVGRLATQKDFPTLLRAFARLRAQRACRLIILGEGRLRGDLEALVAELGLNADVALPGFVDNPHAYVGRARALALSSRWEGFGNVLVEALALDVPVVATDCPSGPREILAEGRYGRLVPVGDARAFAQALHDTLSEPVPAGALQQAARRFEAPRVAAQYLDCLLDGNATTAKGHDG